MGEESSTQVVNVNWMYFIPTLWDNLEDLKTDGRTILKINNNIRACTEPRNLSVP